MPTFGETRTKFLSRLNRRDCTNPLADGFLQDAITRIQRVMKVPAGEKSVEYTIDDANYLDDGRLAIPSDFIKLKDITHTSGTVSTVLQRMPLEKVRYWVENGSQGSTKFFCRQGSGLVLAPTPLEDDVVRVDYFSEYESTSADADESILLDIANDLVVFGALSYGCDHFNDKRGSRFEERFVQILSDIQAQGDDDELTGSAVVGQAFSYPSDE